MTDRQPSPRRRGVRSPTLRDIAERVGVSQGTVSAVLNDAPRARHYSAATKQKIHATAEELGYVANPLGRALKRTRSGTMGCISFNQPDIYYGHLLRSAEQELREHGYEPIMATMNYHRSQFDTCLKRLAAWRVEGFLLMMGGRPVDADMIESLQRLDLPYIVVDAHGVGGTGPSTHLNRESGRLLADHLTELGHRDIAMLGVNPNNSHTTERLEGVTSLLQERGIELPSQRVVEARESLLGAHAGYSYARTLLDRDNCVTALVCINDILAVGAMHLLHERAIRIPEDISVAGFDDVCVDITVTEENRLGAYLWPSLTTVRVPHRELGREAAAALLQRVNHPESAGDWHFTSRPSVIIRASTGPAAR